MQFQHYQLGLPCFPIKYYSDRSHPYLLSLWHYEGPHLCIWNKFVQSNHFFFFADSHPTLFTTTTTTISRSQLFQLLTRKKCNLMGWDPTVNSSQFSLSWQPFNPTAPVALECLLLEGNVVTAAYEIILSHLGELQDPIHSFKKEGGCSNKKVN